MSEARKPLVDGKLVAGVYFGLSTPEYDSLPAIRWSRLKAYLKSAAHGRAAEKRPKESDDLDFGQAVHTAILEPNEFVNRFGAIPDDAPQKRSNADKEWWRQFYAANSSRIMLKPEVLADVKRIAESVYAHPRANLWLTSPKSRREATVVWMDASGHWCKARVDLISNVEGLTRVIDLKSTRDASAHEFARDVANYGYAGQTSWYRRGLNVIAPHERTAALIAIEKVEPFAVVCYDLDVEAQRFGDDEVERALGTFVNAQQSGIFPSYPDGLLSLPGWATKGRE